MTKGYTFNDEDAIIGFKADLGNNFQSLRAGFTGQIPLKRFNENTGFYGTQSLTFGNTTLNSDRDKHSAQIESVSELHFEKQSDSLFVDTHVGAGISLNNTYKQNVSYDSEWGIRPELTQNDKGEYLLKQGFGLVPVNTSGERYDKKFLFDVDARAGIAVGTKIKNDTAIYALAGVNKSLMSKDFSSDFGAGVTGTANIFGGNVVYNVEAKYKKNWNKDLSTNLTNIGGFGVVATVGIPLSW